MGSFSRIERTTGDKATYELYGSGDLHFGRLLHNRRFDFAMVAFLDCLKQLMDYVKSQDSQVDFPHQYVKLLSPRDRCRLMNGAWRTSPQDREGQNWRGICEAAVQSGGGVDSCIAACPVGPEDFAEMDYEREQRVTRRRLGEPLDASRR